MENSSSANSQRLLRYKNLLSEYPKLSKKERETVRRNLSDDFIKFVTEIVFNLKNGAIEIGHRAGNNLKAYKGRMKKLICPQSTLRARKKLVQQGGFLMTLLTNVAIPLLVEALARKYGGQ